MRNFRSRREVLDDINLLFNKIMEVDYGGVNYSKGHEFVFGNVSYESNVFNNQSSNLEVFSYTRDKDFNYSRDEIEAFIIGNDILDKVALERLVKGIVYGDLLQKMLCKKK